MHCPTKKMSSKCKRTTNKVVCTLLDWSLNAYKETTSIIKIVKKSVDWSSSLLSLFSIWKYGIMKACHVDSLTLFLLRPKIDTLQHYMFVNIELLNNFDAIRKFPTMFWKLHATLAKFLPTHSIPHQQINSSSSTFAHSLKSIFLAWKPSQYLQKSRLLPPHLHKTSMIKQYKICFWDWTC
jgi:hypothetical protein